MDNKITGVSLDTQIDGSENVLDTGMAGRDTAHVGIFGQGAAATDALGEITIENYPSSPAIKEKKTTSLTSGDAGEIVQTPDFGVHRSLFRFWVEQPIVIVQMSWQKDPAAD